VNAAACQARNSPGRMGLFLCHERVQSFSIRNLPVNFQPDSHLENEFTELSKSILDTPRSFPSHQREIQVEINKNQPLRATICIRTRFA
jgi:hypothetical protein